MPDNRNIRGPADRQRINVDEDYELKYWSTKFGVTFELLRAAVRAVGPMVRDIARHLGKPV